MAVSRRAQISCGVVLCIAIMILLPAFTADPGTQGSRATDCRICEDDFGDPPPSAPNCSQFGYMPHCWVCWGLTEGCKQGTCWDVTRDYFEGGEWCGQCCSGSNECGGPTPASCEEYHLLDGVVASLTEHPVSGSTSEFGIAGAEGSTEDVERGVLYRSGCTGLVMSRSYTGPAARDAEAQLARITL